LLGLQTTCLLTAALLLGIWRELAAWSLLLGGLAYLVPQAWFTLQASRYGGAKRAAQSVGAFYRGETGKYILTAAIFAAVFATVQPVNVPAVFGGYIGMMVLGVALLAINN